MHVTTDLNPTASFTRILNEVIFDENLTAAEYRVWCQLLALIKGSKGTTTEVMDAAEQLDLPESSFRRHRKALKEKGYLTISKGVVTVTVPSEDFKPKKPLITKEQEERQDVRNAWNTHRPNIYSSLRNLPSRDQVETLRLHAEHNKQEDLTKFLSTVLKGCNADKWWNSHGMSFNNVFGTGEPKQSKFTNVEKLFKLGGSTKGQAAVFDIANDQCWLDWYETKGHVMTEVVRLEMEQYDAWEHQIKTIGDDVLYVYSHGGSVVHWTMKEGSHGVSYLPTAN